MATIQARKGKRRTTYTATVRITGHAPITRTFDLKGEARIWAQEIETAIRRRRYNDPRLAQQVSLEQALDHYRKRVGVHKAATTRAREENCRKRLLDGIGAETSLAEISAKIVASYRDHRLKTVSAYTVRLELALLSHLFEKARREWEIPVENPVKKIDRPAPPRGRNRFLTIEEASRLLSECGKARNPKLRPYILTLLQTGMRSSEAARLRWRDIDLDNRCLYLNKTKTGNRHVPLTKSVVEALSRMRPPSANQDDLVFITEKQLAKPLINQIPSSVFRTSYEAARRRAGLNDVRMHDLRHTAGSWLLMRKVDIRVIAEILGHSTLQMVLRYTHMIDDTKIAAIDSIGDLGI